jgi:hypothetical protein
MANKALATRQKMRLLAKPGKPRNPLAAMAKNRVAGPHVKTESAARAEARRALKKVPLEPEEE